MAMSNFDVIYTEVAAAIQGECQPGTVALGYTALDPHTLEHKPEYKEGLRNFSRIINKQEDFSSLLELVVLQTPNYPYWAALNRMLDDTRLELGEDDLPVARSFSPPPDPDS